MTKQATGEKALAVMELYDTSQIQWYCGTVFICIHHLSADALRARNATARGPGPLSPAEP